MHLANALKTAFGLSLGLPAPQWAGADAREMALSDMIPYTVHYDDETIITKDDGLLQVIKLEGLYFESLSAEQIKQFERQRNTVLRSIANSDRGIYVHLIRRKVHTYPAGEGGTWFSREFNNAWKKRCEQQSFYANEIYISIVVNRFRLGAPGVLDRTFGLLSDATSEAREIDAFEDQAKALNEAAELLVKTMSGYGARKLRIQRVRPGPGCSGSTTEKGQRCSCAPWAGSTPPYRSTATRDGIPCSCRIPRRTDACPPSNFDQAPGPIWARPCVSLNLASKRWPPCETQAGTSCWWERLGSSAPLGRLMNTSLAPNWATHGHLSGNCTQILGAYWIKLNVPVESCYLAVTH